MMERVFLSQLPLMCLSVFRQHLFLQDLNMIILCLMLRLYVRNHFFISQIKHKMNRVEKSQISAVSLLNVKTFILFILFKVCFFSRSENSTLLRTLFFDDVNLYSFLFPYLIQLYQTSLTFPQFSGSLETVSSRKSISFTLQSRKKTHHIFTARSVKCLN